MHGSKTAGCKLFKTSPHPTVNKTQNAIFIDMFRRQQHSHLLDREYNVNKTLLTSVYQSRVLKFELTSTFCSKRESPMLLLLPKNITFITKTNIYKRRLQTSTWLQHFKCLSTMHLGIWSVAAKLMCAVESLKIRNFYQID